MPSNRRRVEDMCSPTPTPWTSKDQIKVIMELGTNIRKLRKEKSYDQEEFAEHIGVTQPYLSQLENGHREPSVSLLQKISEELDISLPGLLLLSMDEEDVQSDRREAFRELRPHLENVLLGDSTESRPPE